MDRDRSDVPEQAVAAYLGVQRWQTAHIEEGVRQADAGDFASPAEVEAAFAKWRK